MSLTSSISAPCTCVKCTSTKKDSGLTPKSVRVCRVCGWDHANKANTVEETPYRD